MECLSSRREREAPGGRARENRKFIQASSPEIWSETISGGEQVLAGKWGWPVLGYLLGKNFRRRDRDHLVPPGGWMQQSACGTLRSGTRPVHRIVSFSEGGPNDIVARLNRQTCQKNWVNNSSVNGAQC